MADTSLRTVTVNQLRALWRTRRGRATASGDSDIARMLEHLLLPGRAVLP